MNHKVPEVTSEELLLSRPIRCELSRLRCFSLESIFGSSLSILDLRSTPWGVALLLGLRGIPSRPHPSEEVK